METRFRSATYPRSPPDRNGIKDQSWGLLASLPATRRSCKTLPFPAGVAEASLSPSSPGGGVASMEISYQCSDQD